MKEILTIITIGTILFGTACAVYEAVTMWLLRRKLDKFAAATKRTAEMVRGMK